MSAGPTPTALATGGVAWEPDLLGRLERRPELTVVRRCVDLTDLLATVGAGTVRAAVVGSTLHRLDREVVARLRRAGVAVVGLCDLDGDDETAGRRLAAIGIGEVLPSSASGAEVGAAVAAAVAALEPDEAWPVAAYEHLDDDVAEPGTRREPGRVVAVWGPAGAPGRTTLAVNVAAELAATGTTTLLADADTYGASVAQTLGLLDEAPGLAAAARAANQGRLEVDALVRHARQLTPTLRVLTGLPRADRWPELRPDGLADVFRLGREVAAVTVVDCGFALEQHEELSFDVHAPRRNGATLTALERADLVVAVGTADPVGLQRLVRGLAELADAVPGADVRVVVNRVRRTVSGGEGRHGPADVLRRHAGVERVWTVPDGTDAVDAALMAGRPLLEVAPRSPVRQAIRAFAAETLAPAVPRARARHGSRRR